MIEILTRKPDLNKPTKKGKKEPSKRVKITILTLALLSFVFGSAAIISLFVILQIYNTTIFNQNNKTINRLRLTDSWTTFINDEEITLLTPVDEINNTIALQEKADKMNWFQTVNNNGGTILEPMEDLMAINASIIDLTLEDETTDKRLKLVLEVNWASDLFLIGDFTNEVSIITTLKEK